ncbi:MAG TPA: TonB-dependent receptor, partial [Pseudomonadales bacterium]
FVRNKHDPIFKNRIGPDLNDGDDWAVRGQLLFEFNDRIDWLVSLRAGEQDVKVAPWSHGSARLNPVTGLGEEFSGGDLTAVGDSRIDEGYRDPDQKLLKGSINIEGFNKIETTGFTSNLKFGIGDNMELVLITDYSELEKDYIEDSDAGPEDFFSFSLRSDIEQFSQEIRLAGSTERTNWVVGAYFLDIDGAFMNGGPASNFFAAAFPDFGLDDPSLETLGLFNPFETDTKSYALFGQVEFDLTDKLRTIAGLRWSREEKEMDFQQYFSLFESTNSFDVAELDGLGLGGAIWTYSPDEVSNVPGGPAFGFDPIIGDSGSASLKDDLITAKLALEYLPSDDLLTYVSYNRGIKAGGYNAPIDATDFYVGARSPEEMRFDEEVLNAYEIGFKLTFAEGRARLNGAAYYYDYQDYQAFDLDSLTTIVFNTDAENYGLELELQATPTDGLDLLLGASWMHNNVEDAFTRPDGVDIDRKAVLTPEVNLNGMVRYQWSALGGFMSVQGDATYMSKHYFQLKNSPVGTEKAYTIVNTRVSWESAKGDWLLSVFLDNVFDEDHRLMVFDLAGSPAEGGFGMYESYAGQPRWWGASVRYSWGI